MHDKDFEITHTISLNHLEALKVYSPIYDTTFDLMNEEQRNYANYTSIFGGTKMSKEMTAKEALKVLVNNLDQAKLKELSSSDDYWTKYEEVSEAINVLENIILYNEVMEDV